MEAIDFVAAVQCQAWPAPVKHGQFTCAVLHPTELNKTCRRVDYVIGVKGSLNIIIIPLG